MDMLIFRRMLKNARHALPPARSRWEQLVMNKSDNRICGLDIFAGINALFFLWMCHAVYFDRFVHYRGREYLWEFFVYALIILVLIAVTWKTMRNLQVPAWILVLVQASIVLHFVGGLAVWHEARLYDKIIFNIRYDKYIHFYNSFVCAVVLYFFCFRNSQTNRWLTSFELIFLVLGIGAFVEIVEYLVTLTIAKNGVGGYDNNMQDMIANFLGSSCCVLVTLGVERIKSSARVKGVLPEKEWMRQ